MFFFFCFHHEAFLQELAVAMITAVGSDSFFNLFEGEGKLKYLQRLAEKYVALYQADSVANIAELNPGVKAASRDIFRAFSCLLVLLHPVPGYLGTSVSNLTDFMSAHDESNTLVNGLNLFLKEDEAWQSRVDDCLKVGLSTLKLGQELQKLTSDLEEEDVPEADMSLITAPFKAAVQAFPAMRGNLKEGATDNLAQLVKDRVVKIVERLCQVSSVDSETVNQISTMTYAINLFASDRSIMELRSKFVEWQGKVSQQLFAENLANMTQTLEKQEVEGGAFHFSLPPTGDMLSLLQKLERGSEPMEEKVKRDLQYLSWALLRTLRFEAWFRSILFTLV